MLPEIQNCFHHNFGWRVTISFQIVSIRWDQVFLNHCWISNVRNLFWNDLFSLLTMKPSYCEWLLLWNERKMNFSYVQSLDNINNDNINHKYQWESIKQEISITEYIKNVRILIWNDFQLCSVCRQCCGADQWSNHMQVFNQQISSMKNKPSNINHQSSFLF